MSSRKRILEIIASIPPLIADGFASIQFLLEPKCDLLLASDYVRCADGLQNVLVRQADSRRFAASSSFDPIWQAITRFGTKHVFNLALGLAFLECVGRPLVAYGSSSESFFRHAVAVALLSESLMEESGVAPPRFLFCSALLHDIGKIPIDRFLIRNGLYTGDMLKQCNPRERRSVERSLCGIDHAEAGALQAAAWGLPDEVIGIIQHHRTGRGPRTPLDVLGVIARAEGLVGSFLNGDSADPPDGGHPAGARGPASELDRRASRAIERARPAFELWMTTCLPDVSKISEPQFSPVREFAGSISVSKGGPSWPSES